MTTAKRVTVKKRRRKNKTRKTRKTTMMIRKAKASFFSSIFIFFFYCIIFAVACCCFFCCCTYKGWTKKVLSSCTNDEYNRIAHCALCRHNLNGFTTINTFCIQRVIILSNNQSFDVLYDLTFLTKYSFDILMLVKVQELYYLIQKVILSLIKFRHSFLMTWDIF